MYHPPRPNYPGAPPNQNPPYGAPPGQAPPNYNAPPSYNSAPPPGQPMFSAPPGQQPGFSAAPQPAAFRPPGPPSMNAPPAIQPPAMSPGFLAAPAPAAPRPSVQFFSTTGGIPVPTAAASTSPPSGMMPPPGNQPGPSMMPPPPMMGGPPNTGMAAPPMMAPPPTMGANVMPGMQPPTMGAVSPPSYPSANSMAGMPTGFDTGSANNLSVMASGAMPGQPGMSNAPAMAGVDPTGNSTVGAPLPLIDEMDLSIQCNPMFMRATIGKVVNSQAAASASRVPLGLVCKPMFGDVGITNEEIEVVDFGNTGIVRCKRCRTYINPYVTWADNGRRWRCNICGMLNDVPSTYFSHLDGNGQRRDKVQRPELSRCSVEFIAPSDYMVRPPQPPVYYFVIDVSEASVASGMIQSAVNAIKESLDQLPGTPRTQIGFITFDAHIHFYNLKSSLASPQMLVVSDVFDVILPSPEDLLVNLQDSRTVVDALLDALPSMFKGTTAVNTCTGPALLAAKRVIQHLGGKLLLFQSSLPSIGEGSLKMRENPRLVGTDKEHTLLNAEDPWYKTNAIDFSRLQVCVDTFLFSSQYIDLATIAVLSKYTAGSTYYYPGFIATRDGKKFEKELHHDLTRSTAFEAVMRVRATRGLRFSNFYGNYFIRGTDLLALPNCTSDSTFALDMTYDESQLSAQVITIQAALLYTSSAGERRIRVHTMVLPVTPSAAEMVESLDIDCAMNLLSKQAVDISLKTGLENARQRVHATTVDILRAAKSGFGASGMQPGMNQYGMAQPAMPSANAPIPTSLLLLPLYSMSLQKSLVLRGGTDVRIDERAYFQQLLYNMDIEESKVFIYPRLFSVHDMGTDIGLPSDNADDDCPTAGAFQVRLPSILNLSYERLSSNGLFLLENGYDLFIWIGRGVNPAIISTLFGFPTLDGVDMSMLSINSENSDFSMRVNAVVNALREDRARHMQLHFIREGDGYAEAYFARFLIEDRANFPGGSLSYTEFHAHVTRAISGMPG